MGRVVTYRELLRLLSQKITEPASDGQAGQRLTTNGAGGRTWSGSGSIIAADRVRIDGNEYVVRTGETGAAGFLTIGENTLWLGTTPFLFDLGGRGVKQIYKDTSLIYEKPSGVYTLFDNGWVDGINWGGNLLPRPQYTTLGYYDLSLVESNGYMKLYVPGDPSYSDVSYNCHVCTAASVAVPQDATKMFVRVNSVSAYIVPPYMVFGLLTDDCVNAMDASRGGQLSGLTTLTKNAYTDYSITLNDGIAGSSYRAVVNLRASGKRDGTSDAYIQKVWFE